VTQFATARIGAILVNVNPAYKAAELEYALNQSGVSLLLMAEGFRQTDYRALFAEAERGCPNLREVIVLGEGWQELLASGAGTVAGLTEREQGLSAADAINIQYTSGTTGAPKGATLSHKNILNNAYFIARTLQYSQNDRVCIPVPFYHCFGMVLGNLACAVTGACMVTPGEAFDAPRTLQAVADERCTALYGVPTMFVAALGVEGFENYDLRTLRTGIMAGSPCPVEVMKAVQAKMHMKEVTIAYGMTETSPVSTQTRIGTPLSKQVSTVGQVHPHVEIKIVDQETRETVPRGTAGELCTKGYSVMLGYWENEAATREAIDGDGWMRTGDLASMDEEGYVQITGRLKDMVCRGGENIYPREVEEFLQGHPRVAEVQVIGVPSEKYVEEVMAWVRLTPGKALSGEDLVQYCRGKISTYKIPRYWKFVEEFPLTVTGKVQKFRMREISIKELGLAELHTA